MIAKSVEPVFGDSSWMGFGFGSLDYYYLDWIFIIGFAVLILLHARLLLVLSPSPPRRV